MNPQFDEHLRDSAPDSSRFDGFDRGDLDKADDACDFKVAPRDPGKPSTALRLLASLGFDAFKPRSDAFNGLESLLPSFGGQHTTSKLRRAQRKMCRELGRRQYRRATRLAYALRNQPAI